MNYSYRLKELRSDAGFEQEKIANILNVKQNAYSQYETGYVTIPIKHLIRVCDFFKVSLDFIFELTDKRSYPYFDEGYNLDLSIVRLKELRKEFKLTQSELANSIGVSKSTISEYERHSNKIIATSFLYAISKKYNYSADYLLGKINYPKYVY